jgi:hypothetical protein
MPLTLHDDRLQTANVVKPRLWRIRIRRFNTQPHALILKQIDGFERLKYTVAIDSFDWAHGGHRERFTP